MLLQFLPIQKPPLITPSLLLKGRVIVSALLFDNEHKNLKKRRTNSSLCAVEEESHFELDPDKAREALQKLDQQLQTLSQKQITPPKKKVLTSNMVPDADRMRDLMREEMPEFSTSDYAYSAFALLFFTIFYNIVFITIIQPAVDGREPTPPPLVREAPNAKRLQQSPPPPSPPPAAVTSQR